MVIAALSPADRPVIIGGVARCRARRCNVARLRGGRSAMPLFRALTACPDAVVIQPDLAKCRGVGVRCAPSGRGRDAAPKAKEGI